jgi:hypothetical protein
LGNYKEEGEKCNFRGAPDVRLHFFLLIFFTSLAYIEKKELLARAKVVAQLKNVPNFN